MEEGGAIMKYEDITPAMRAFLGNREMVRRLGFHAGDIYCMPARSARFSGLMSCFLSLRTGGKEFNIECGPCDSEDKLSAEYMRVLQAVNSGGLPDADYFRIFQECESYQITSDLIRALGARGIIVPILHPSKALERFSLVDYSSEPMPEARFRSNIPCEHGVLPSVTTHSCWQRRPS